MTEPLNTSESKCSFELNQNTKGFTTSTKGYQGVKLEELKDLIDTVISGHNYAQLRLAGKSREEIESE